MSLVFLKSLPPGLASSEQALGAALAAVYPNATVSSMLKVGAVVDLKDETVAKSVVAAGSITLDGTAIKAAMAKENGGKSQPATNGKKDGATTTNTTAAVAPKEKGPSVAVLELPAGVNAKDVEDAFQAQFKDRVIKVSMGGSKQKVAFVEFKTEQDVTDAIAMSKTFKIKDSPVVIEARTSKPRQKTPKVSAAPTENGATATTNGGGDPSQGEKKKKKKKKKSKGAKKENGEKPAASSSSSSAPASEKVNKGIHIRNLPFTATEEDINSSFAKFGTISRIGIRAMTSAVFIDYASEEELAKSLKSAEESSSTPKTGSFGTATLSVSKSTSKKHQDSHAMRVVGFTGEQTPTSEDISKLFGPAKNIDIIAARRFAFVDFTELSALEAALKAASSEGIKLPGASSALEIEPSKPKSNTRKGARRGKKAAAAGDGVATPVVSSSSSS